MHSQLVLANAHGQSPLLGLVSCHKAAVHVLVEPGVMASGEVRHHSGKLDGPLNACPVNQEMMKSVGCRCSQCQSRCSSPVSEMQLGRTAEGVALKSYHFFMQQ